MQFEGDKTNIPVTVGINRSGADINIPIGSCNEVIGMEHKDGSLVPYCAKETSVVMPNELTASGKSECIKTWVHKTSMIDVDLYLLGNGRLMYKYNGSMSYYLISDKAEEVAFVGNTICVKTSDKIEYYTFTNEGGTYHYKENKTVQVNDLGIKLRTTLGMITDDGADDVVGIFKKEYFEHTKIDLSPKEALLEMEAIVGEATTMGGLTGYFLACTAFRMSDGSIRHMSEPVLMCAPDSDSFQKAYRIHNDGTRTAEDILTPHVSNGRRGQSDNNTTADGAEEVKIPFYKLVDEKYIGNDNNIPGSTLKLHSDAYVWGAGSYGKYEPYPLLSIRDDVHLLYYDALGITNKVDHHDGYTIVCAKTNKLQFIPGKKIDKESGVVGVCVLMSREISQWSNAEMTNLRSKTFYQEDVLSKTAFHDDTDTHRGIVSILTKKPFGKVIEQIASLQNMYLVHEFSIEEYNAMSDEVPSNIDDAWIDIDLRGKLGETLVTMESASIVSGVMQNSPYGSEFCHNGKLHILGSVTRWNNDTNEDSLEYNKGERTPEQYDVVLDNCSDTSLCLSIVRRKNDMGNEIVYRTNYIFNTDNVVKSLAPAIVIGSDEVLEATVQFRTIDINNGMMMSDKKSLNVIVSNTGGTNLITSSTGDSVETRPIQLFSGIDDAHKVSSFDFDKADKVIQTGGGNIMRVSDTYMPMYFQNSSVFVIGNGEIIGCARLSIALSHDTFGRYPLLVFCTDGIYMLNTDTSGAGSYTSAVPFSRSVCSNKNSICEIDGAVVFATDSGLMVATSSGVSQFLPELIGEPKNLPAKSASTRGNGMLYYDMATSKVNATLLSNSISRNDFLQFINDSDTHICYVHKKNKVIVYNKKYEYSYWIDIQSKVTTKLSCRIEFCNDDYPDEKFYKNDNGIYTEFDFVKDSNTDCDTLIQTRAIVLPDHIDSALRCVARGEFKADSNKRVLSYGESSFDFDDNDTTVELYHPGEILDRVTNIDFVSEKIIDRVIKKGSGFDNTLYSLHVGDTAVEFFVECTSSGYKKSDVSFDRDLPSVIDLEYKLTNKYGAVLYSNIFSAEKMDMNHYKVDLTNICSSIDLVDDWYTETLEIVNARINLQNTADLAYNGETEQGQTHAGKSIVFTIDKQDVRYNKLSDRFVYDNILVYESAKPVVEKYDPSSSDYKGSKLVLFNKDELANVDPIIKLKGNDAVFDTKATNYASIRVELFHKGQNGQNTVLWSRVFNNATFKSDSIEFDIPSFEYNFEYYELQQDVYLAVYLNRLDVVLRENFKQFFEYQESYKTPFDFNNMPAVSNGNVNDDRQHPKSDATYDILDNGGQVIGWTHEYNNQKLTLPFNDVFSADVNDSVVINQDGSFRVLQENKSGQRSSIGGHVKFRGFLSAFDGLNKGAYFMASLDSNLIAGCNTGFNDSSASFLDNDGVVFVKLIKYGYRTYIQDGDVISREYFEDVLFSEQLYCVDRRGKTLIFALPINPKDPKTGCLDVNICDKNGDPFTLTPGDYKVVIDYSFKTSTSYQKARGLFVEMISDNSDSDKFAKFVISRPIIGNNIAEMNIGECINTNVVLGNFPVLNYVVGVGENRISSAYQYVTLPKYKNGGTSYADMLVLGSLDGEHWKVIGVNEKPLSDKFNDLGCKIDRMSGKYIMVIVSGHLNKDSHVDRIELTTKQKYNNKLK